MNMRDLNAAIQAAASQTGTRQTIGEGVSWGGLPVPNLWPSMVTQQSSNALQFYSTDITAGTPSATATPARGTKQVGATVATQARTIEKWGLQALLSLEDWEQAPDSIAATLSTLLAKCTVMQEGGAFAALDAAAAEVVTPATSWVAAIANAQGALVGRGHAPGLVVVAAVDWADLALEIAASSGLVTPSSDAIINVLGSRVAVSPNAAGGEGFVVDPSAVTTVLRDAGFLVTAVPATNEILCVADLLASTFVTSSSGVEAIAVA